MKSGENCSSGLRKENYTILYMYIAQGQGQITPRGQNFDYNKCFTTFFIHGKFQPLVFDTFLENDLTFSPIQMYGDANLTLP